MVISGPIYQIMFTKLKMFLKTILVDNLKSNRLDSLFNSKKKNNLNFFNKDLNDIKSLDEFNNVDLIIHCASMTNAEKSFGKEKEMFNNNINCMKTVIKYCGDNNTKLVHLSSTSVYGKQTKLVDETCEKKFLKPQSPYAKIKIIEENLLKKKVIKLDLILIDLELYQECQKELDFIQLLINFV